MTTNQLVLCRATCQRCGNVEILPMSVTVNDSRRKMFDVRLRIGGEYKNETISAERLAEMREAVRNYGSANCWTGTTGTLAAMVFELLKAIGEERGT